MFNSLFYTGEHFIVRSFNVLLLKSLKLPNLFGLLLNLSCLSLNNFFIKLNFLILLFSWFFKFSLNTTANSFTQLSCNFKVYSKFLLFNNSSTFFFIFCFFKNHFHSLPQKQHSFSFVAFYNIIMQFVYFGSTSLLNNSQTKLRVSEISNTVYNSYLFNNFLSAFVYNLKYYNLFLLQSSALKNISSVFKSSNLLLYNSLLDLFAVDYPTRLERFDVVYVFLSVFFNKRMLLKTFVSENSYLESLSNIYSSANWLERES